MDDLYGDVKRAIQLTRVAAFAANPLHPGLTIAEIRSIVVQDGFAIPLVDEAMEQTDLGRGGRAGRGEAAVFGPGMHDLLALRIQGGFPPQIPYVDARKVCDSFSRLNREQGARSPKTVPMLSHASLPTDQVERGLGFLLQFSLAQEVPGGYVSQTANLDGYVDERPRGSELEKRLDILIGRVKSVLAARTAASTISTPPTDRFHLFLKKQGLHSMAGWWSMTNQEMLSLGYRSPTSVTVLAASMLEAALVAIAEPARNAGEWKRDFLGHAPKDWKLGALIDQAEAAGTFSATDAAHARLLAELRNRIHVGKYAVAGPDRFKPVYADSHEATIATKHLDMLLSRILSWSPIAALT